MSKYVQLEKFEVRICNMFMIERDRVNHDLGRKDCFDGIPDREERLFAKRAAVWGEFAFGKYFNLAFDWSLKERVGSHDFLIDKDPDVLPATVDVKTTIHTEANRLALNVTLAKAESGKGSDYYVLAAARDREGLVELVGFASHDVAMKYRRGGLRPGEPDFFRMLPGDLVPIEFMVRG